MSKSIILHLEDDENLRDTIGMVFDSYLPEFDIVSKATPSKAFAAIENKEFSIDDLAIVVTDGYMIPHNLEKGGVETGWYAADELRRRNYQGPIIILTAVGETLAPEHMNKFDERITKPFNNDNLVDVMKELMRKSSEKILTK